MSEEQKVPPEGIPNGSTDRPPGLSVKDRETLRGVARDSIRHGLDTGLALDVDATGYPSALEEPGASFVTLELDGQLRGCVGSLTVRLPLVEDVARNAYAAAFQDYRFSPLSDEEFPRVEFHVSRLTPLEPLDVESREDLLETLRPGVDGLVLEDPPHRSTFLPQVWESLQDPEDFLRELLRKAGLPPDHWSPTLSLHRYRVEEF